MTNTIDNSYMLTLGVNVAVYINSALTIVEVTDAITENEFDALEAAYKIKVP